MSFPSNRRQFLQSTAVAGIGFWVAGGLQAKESKSPNERVAVASIGIGGMGSDDTKNAANHADLVAICDVDEDILNAGKKKYPKAKDFHRFPQAARRRWARASTR